MGMCLASSAFYSVALAGLRDWNTNRKPLSRILEFNVVDAHILPREK